MGSASDTRITTEQQGIIPRVIKHLFQLVEQKEASDPTSTYKIQVQFLEIYGEDIKDLLDHTKTSKVTIRETSAGDVFVVGAREEVVSSTTQMIKALEDGTRHRTTASTRMNQSSSRSHGKPSQPSTRNHAQICSCSHGFKR
jgi:Kinesin motor domain